MCRKVKEEKGCKSTPLAQNLTSFLLFFLSNQCQITFRTLNHKLNYMLATA